MMMKVLGNRDIWHGRW